MAAYIITSVPITERNDSRAHVIPSALGGRLKPYGILSTDANQLLNDKVDLPLVKAFQPLMTLLGGSRDRGRNPAIKVTDNSGEIYSATFGNELSLTRPKFVMDEQADGGFTLEIEARSIDELRTLLGQFKKKQPSHDIEKILQQAKIVQKMPEGPLGIQLQLGPAVTFPAAFVAASIFAAYKNLDVHSGLKTYIKNFDQTAVPVNMPPDTFYFYPPKGAVELACEAGHSIVLIADPNRSKALCLINYFNIESIGVVLPYYGSYPVSYSYAINIITGQEFLPLIAEDLVRSMKWEPTHVLGEASLFDVTRVRIEKIMYRATLRVFEADTIKIVEKELYPADGRTLTEADFNRVIHEVAKYIIFRNTLGQS